MTIRRWIAIAVVALLFGCARDPVANTGSGVGSATATPPIATGSGSGAPDPWAPSDDLDEDLPDATVTRRLADQACPMVKAPYYWRIAKAGKVSYMLGTRHLGVPLSKMPAKVTDQITKASLVVFETPPGDEGGNAVGRQPDKPLPELLGADLWAKYRRLVGRRTAKMLEGSSVAVALLTLMMMYEDKLSALDLEIQTLVQDKNIKTAGLESSAFQDTLLAELLDLRMLKATILGTPDRKSIEKESMEDLKEYCDGTDDQPGMDERSKKSLKAGGYSDDEIKRLDEKLLDDRNNRWMPELEKLFAKGNVFVVVGADHLIGERGVVKMLAKRGYTTTRVAP